MSNGFFLSPEYDIASFQNGKLLLKNISNASKTLPATDNSAVHNKSDKAFVSTVKDFITTRNLGSNTDDDELTNKYYVKYFQITNPSDAKCAKHGVEERHGIARIKNNTYKKICFICKNESIYKFIV